MAKASKRRNVKFDSEKAEDWLNTHWQGDQICPVCGNSEWFLHDEAVEVRTFGEGRLAASGSVIPLMIVICTTCANTLFFNALVAGLVEQPEEA